MTGKDLLTAMSGIDGRYIEEAAPAAAPKTRSLRRPLLVAAAIAAALLLVGCGIVYALRLQDMSIGKASYTQRFDDKGKAIDPVEKSLDIITPYGRSGDAIQQALKEWYEFQESYDPDGALVDRRTRYSGHSQPVRVHLQLLYPGNGGQGGRDRRKVQSEAAGRMDTLPAVSERHFP